MAVSNPASLQSIVTEFGGDGVFSHYYAGGPYVPSGATDGSGNPIPASGVLSMSQFNGAANALEVMSMTVGTNGSPSPLYGYDDGQAFGPFGSLSPDSFFAGGTVTSFVWNSGANNMFLVLDNGGGADPGQSCFDHVIINGTTFHASSASYGGGTWTWSSVSDPFGSGSITITFR
jgi:hypothetical protein